MLRFRVSRLGVSGFVVRDFNCGISGSGFSRFGVFGAGFRDTGLRGFEFRGRGFGFGVSRFVFSGLVFRGLGLGFRVWR